MPDWSSPEEEKMTVDELFRRLRVTPTLDIEDIRLYAPELDPMKVKLGTANAALLKIVDGALDVENQPMDNASFWANMVLMGFLAGYQAGRNV